MLRTLAKVIGVVGSIACLLGAGLYYLFTLPAVMNLPLEWSYIIIDGVALVVFIVAAVVLALISNSVRHKEYLAMKAIEAERAAAKARAEEAAALAVAEEAAAAIEICEDEAEEEAAIKYPAVIEKVREKLPAEVNETVDKVVTVVKENKDVIIPVVAGIAATVILVKSVKNARCARNRKKLYKWLG